MSYTALLLLITAIILIVIAIIANWNTAITAHLNITNDTLAVCVVSGLSAIVAIISIVATINHLNKQIEQDRLHFITAEQNKLKAVLMDMEFYYQTEIQNSIEITVAALNLKKNWLARQAHWQQHNLHQELTDEKN